MKKWLPLLLILMMIIGSIPTWAATDFSNISATYDKESERLTIEGETTNTAIALFVYKPNGDLINFTSRLLDNSTFTVIFEAINADVAGTYKVKLANYSGGEYTTATFTIAADNGNPSNPSNPNPPDTTPPVVTPPVTVPPVKPTEPVKEVVVKGTFEATGSYQTPLSELKEVDKLEIKGDISMVFDAKALAKIGITGDLEVTAKPVAAPVLDETLKKQIGDRPIYEFKVAVDGTSISQFGSGSITVSIPYTLKAGENPNAILVYYLDANGKVKTMKSKYENGQVTFTTNHFSKYAVGYNPITFSDVSETDWYYEFVTYLSSRNLINGKAPLRFSPSAQITRAEVVTVLAKMSGEELTIPKAAVFKDVKANDWYAASVYWAYKKGIISGMNDMTFAPNQPISRQDLTVILSKYLEKVESTSLKEVNTAVTFKDASEIAPYAKDAVTEMQLAGIISGKANNAFDPKGNATRAEVTKVLTLLLKSLIQ